MSRLNLVQESYAHGRTAKLFDHIHRATGRILNMFRGLANSPAALSAYLKMSESLKTGKLTSDEHRIIALIVSDELGSEYCIQTHRKLAEMQGMEPNEINLLLEGRAKNEKHASLARFIRAVIRTAGNIPDDRLSSIRSHGYGDDHITEMVGVIALSTYANYFNTLNRTDTDEALDTPTIQIAREVAEETSRP